MNLDDYIKELHKYSDDETVRRLINHLQNWKNNQSNIHDLDDEVEHFFGNSWIQSGIVHETLYKLWSSFKTQAINNIGGMTVNERLYWFGLFECIFRPS